MKDTKYLIMKILLFKTENKASYTGLHLLIFHKLKMGRPSPILIINYSIVSLVCNRNRSEHGTMKLTVVIQRVWCIHRNSKVIVPTAPL
jgi:hypothetical protein